MTTERAGARPAKDLALPRGNAMLAAATMGGVLVTLDISVVNVALETLQRSFDVRLSALQWIMNIYTLPYAALLLSAGALADRIGVRRLFIVGFGLFTLSSLACAAAPSFPILLTARARACRHLNVRGVLAFPFSRRGERDAERCAVDQAGAAG